MTLIIERLNGKKYNLRELGIRVVEFEPESLTVKNEVVELDGGGVVVQGRGYGARYISASFKISAYDLDDYALYRAELFDLFGTIEPFYIIDTKEPGKRWHVRSDGNFSFKRAVKNGNFDVNFVCVKIFAESIRTALDLQRRKEWDIDYWQWGMGIDWDTDYTYTHSSNSFDVKNIGTAAVDPSNWELEITVKATASQYLQITNNTTRETYRFNGALTANDTLIIRGVRTFKNGVSAFSSTNFKLLSLAVGDNSFTVTGGTIRSISFNFRFPFK